MSVKDHHSVLKSELARRDETIQKLRRDVLNLQEKRDAAVSEVRTQWEGGTSDALWVCQQRCGLLCEFWRMKNEKTPLPYYIKFESCLQNAAHF